MHVNGQHQSNAWPEKDPDFWFGLDILGSSLVKNQSNELTLTFSTRIRVLFVLHEIALPISQKCFRFQCPGPF